jgi:hypothetical protein
MKYFKMNMGDSMGILPSLQSTLQNSVKSIGVCRAFFADHFDYKKVYLRP